MGGGSRRGLGWLVGWLYDTAMAAGGSPPGESSRRAYVESTNRGGVICPCLPTALLSCPRTVWRARPDCCPGPLLPTISPLPSEPSRPLVSAHLHPPCPASHPSPGLPLPRLHRTGTFQILLCRHR